MLLPNIILKLLSAQKKRLTQDLLFPYRGLFIIALTKEDAQYKDHWVMPGGLYAYSQTLLKPSHVVTQ